MSLRRFLTLMVLAVASAGVWGCGTTGGKKVEVFNDTDFDLLPNLQFGPDPATFPGLPLATGVVSSGDSPVFSLQCIELGAIFSNEAELLLLGQPIATANDSVTLKRGTDFNCGDQIEFHFTDNGGKFTVEVSVNGNVVQ